MELLTQPAIEFECEQIPLEEKKIKDLSTKEFYNLINSAIRAASKTYELPVILAGIDTDLGRRIKSHQDDYVYGLIGIQTIFGCSKRTAQRIVESGRFKDSIHKIGKYLLIDARTICEDAAATGYSVKHHKITFPEKLIREQQKRFLSPAV